MKDNKPTITVPCPECEEEINLWATPAMGQKVTCPECWAYLEVISLEPLALAWEADLFEDDAYNDWAIEEV